MDFLQGLNESYASVQSQLLLMGPLPSVNKAYSLLLQEEHQRSLTDFKHQQPDHAAMSTHAAPNSSKSSHHTNSGNTRPKYHCSHCNIDGHSNSRCFKLHGYPPNCGGPLSNRGGSSSNRGGRSFNNGSQLAPRPDSKFVAATPLTDNTSSPFSLEQVQQLLTLLPPGNTHGLANFTGSPCFTAMPSCNSWIIDSGATNHMI
ncbi:hypothetical protein CFOL_v3_33591 [Cephalotus follicularis]|uniref:UBN2_3 domain-containing protein n=1 Tax=Cephalotus follicularis TaxID=3775 RepID=A0A1Q3DCJ8_CEPFO|nr:hypothetical protein CFOL_v3_33591 [Cephalotus follicularis]